jgi:hypothetical protein
MLDNMPTVNQYNVGHAPNVRINAALAANLNEDQFQTFVSTLPPHLRLSTFRKYARRRAPAAAARQPRAPAAASPKAQQAKPWYRFGFGGGNSRSRRRRTHRTKRHRNKKRRRRTHRTKRRRVKKHRKTRRR